MNTPICQSCKQNFSISDLEVMFYEKMNVPSPTFCPACRMVRRFVTRNERSLYTRTCDLCKAQILSIYAPDAPYVVYCPLCWWSDKWDPLSLGKEYDFSRPFFEQYAEFKKTVPHEAMFQTNFVNSAYCNFGLNFTNCYLVFGGYDNENAAYSNQIGNVKDSMEVSFSWSLEKCYEAIACSKSSFLKFCLACDDSTDLTFCIDCRGSLSCFGCVGMRQKQYHIFNKPYSREGYETKLKEINIGSHEGLKKAKAMFSEFLLTQPYKYARFKNAPECTGDYILNSSKCNNAFSLQDVENSSHLFYGVTMKDSQDAAFVGKGSAELLYEVISSFGGQRQVVGIRTLFDQNSYYSEDCHNCSNIFACIGLRRQKYCFFNKQYSPEEFESLKGKVVKHMNDMPYKDKKGNTYRFGEFWPAEMSPFAYNETIAQEYFPLSKKTATQKGFLWNEKGKKETAGALAVVDLPDTIEDVDKQITNKIIKCEHVPSEASAKEGGANCSENCAGAFKIIPQELKLLQELRLPLPRLCPNCRHRHRLERRNPLRLWPRACQCAGTLSDNKVYNNTIEHFHKAQHCPNTVETSYAPERAEIVYCETCYLSEVV